jgi:hypothetical protein
LHGAVLEFGENEATGCGLERAGHDHSPGFADMRAGMIDHDHRSIWKITNGLMRLATFFNQMQIDFVARDNCRSKCAREVGQIQNGHAL